MHDLVVIGGGGAGLTAALTARKLNWDANIVLISKTDISYSPCALPFVISGEIPDFDNITHDLKEICEVSHIECVIDEVVEVDAGKRKVKTRGGKEFKYNSLVFATGGIPRTIDIKGKELKGVFSLQTIDDARKIRERAKESKHAYVVGGGAVGVEAAAALRKLGLEVTLIELCSQIFSHCFDPDFSELITKELVDEGINVVTEKCISEYVGSEYVEEVVIEKKKHPADMVIVGIGLIPNGVLAEKSGVTVKKGAIQIDGWMQTNIKGVYAAGDCVFTRSLVSGQPMLSQLGTSATRQGRIAGSNAVGVYATTEGVLNSMVLKVFDLEIGRTGLTENDAISCGIEHITGKIKTTTKPPYFPGVEDIYMKLIFNKINNRIIGAQIVGGGEGVADKVDLCAFAIQNYSTMDDLMNLKYCYTPPLTPIDNAIVDAAENAFRKLQRLKESQKRGF